jgi:hypothetical protein
LQKKGGKLGLPDSYKKITSIENETQTWSQLYKMHTADIVIEVHYSKYQSRSSIEVIIVEVHC